MPAKNCLMAGLKCAKKPGGGGTPLQEANRDVPLDGVTFSRLD